MYATALNGAQANPCSNLVQKHRVIGIPVGTAAPAACRSAHSPPNPTANPVSAAPTDPPTAADAAAPPENSITDAISAVHIFPPLGSSEVMRSVMTLANTIEPMMLTQAAVASDTASDTRDMMLLRLSAFLMLFTGGVCFNE